MQIEELRGAEIADLGVRAPVEPVVSTRDLGMGQSQKQKREFARSCTKKWL